MQWPVLRALAKSENCPLTSRVTSFYRIRATQPSKPNWIRVNTTTVKYRMWFERLALSSILNCKARRISRQILAWSRMDPNRSCLFSLIRVLLTRNYWVWISQPISTRRYRGYANAKRARPQTLANSTWMIIHAIKLPACQICMDSTLRNGCRNWARTIEDKQIFAFPNRIIGRILDFLFSQILGVSWILQEFVFLHIIAGVVI